AAEEHNTPGSEVTNLNYGELREAVQSRYDQLRNAGLSHEEAWQDTSLMAANAHVMSGIFGMTPRQYVEARYPDFIAMSQKEFDDLGRTGLDGLFDNREVGEMLEAMGVTQNMTQAQRRRQLDPEWAYAYGRVDRKSAIEWLGKEGYKDALRQFGPGFFAKKGEGRGLDNLAQGFLLEERGGYGNATDIDEQGFVDKVFRSHEEFERGLGRELQKGALRQNRVGEAAKKLTAQEKLAQDAAAWAETVQNFINGKIDREQHTLQLLSQTPIVFNLVDAKQLPVHTKASVLRKVLFDKHNLKPELVKQVAEKLADPVMVVKSIDEYQASNITVMLELMDENKASIIVPVIFSDKKHGYEMNFAPSIYAKNNLETKTPSDQWFVDQLKAGNVLYANKKKIRRWNRIAQRQLPGWNSIPNAKSIKFEDDLVKLKEQFPGHYQSGKASTARGAYTRLPDGKRLVALFEQADASTVLHETGHFFLDELGEASKLETAPQWVRDATATIEREYNAQGFFDGTLDDAARTAAHERFARDFEAYLREGRAPSRELRTAFEKFKEWLTQIYATVQKLLGKERLSEDIRQVFDSLLATDRELLFSPRGEDRPALSLPRNELADVMRLGLAPQMKRDLARGMEKALSDLVTGEPVDVGPVLRDSGAMANVLGMAERNATPEERAGIAEGEQGQPDFSTEAREEITPAPPLERNADPQAAQAAEAQRTQAFEENLVAEVERRRQEGALAVDNNCLVQSSLAMIL
ncbi:MAG: hypothetical protein IJU37_04875, partial [Desulfovibrio sp.]|nr:hypothetical protein [Desulfovibrio sp.]